MTEIQILDLFVCLVQQYMLTHLMYRMGKTKYNYRKTVLISMPVMFGLYFVFNYMVDNYILRAVVSILSYPICGILIYDGKLLYRLKIIVLCYGIFVGLDFVCMHFLMPWMPVNDYGNTLSPGILVGRNIYNIIFYGVLVLMELYWNRKEKASKMSQLAVTFVALAVAQFVIMYALVSSNYSGMSEHLTATTIFYTGLIVVGYFITMEMLRQTINQQRKQGELEHKMLERKYQYDYYLLARQQSEELRDLRHDMRNQLQTVHYLMSIEGEKGRAHEMMRRLVERLES